MRTWWVPAEVLDPGYGSAEGGEPPLIHVIEKSAYSALQDKIYHLSRAKDEEIYLLKAEIDGMQMKQRDCIVCGAAIFGWTDKAERDRLKLLAESYRAALDKAIETLSYAIGAVESE